MAEIRRGIRIDRPSSGGIGLALDLGPVPPSSIRSDSTTSNLRKLHTGIDVPQESFLNALPELVAGNHPGHREPEVKAAVMNPIAGRTVRFPVAGGAGEMTVERLDKNTLRVSMQKA